MSATGSGTDVRRRAGSTVLNLRERAGPIRDSALLFSRRPSASMRLLPDFLIIGAQKGGTTFLRAALAEHPAITMSLKPEVHYFDFNHHRGPNWYRAHFPTRGARERSLRRRGEFATGEKSPYYLFAPSVAGRVSALLPDAKLIVMLRDPVARALSHHQQATRLGHETLPFENALAAEARQCEQSDDRVAPGNGVLAPLRRSYVARGRYAEQLERWLVHFDREQIHITLSERIFADPSRWVSEVQRFIGVTPMVREGLAPQNRADYEQMSPALRARLQGLFAEDVKRLTPILGEDPGWW